jgi:hypothetical protein
VLIPVVRWPGTWIDGLTDQQANEAQSQLRLMQAGLDEAAITLHLYQAAKFAAHAEPHGREVWEAEQAERAAVEQELRSSQPDLAVGATGWWEREEEFRAQIDQETNRRAWQSGRWPSTYRKKLSVLHARSFLYALDGTSKALGVLGKQSWVPVGISVAQAEWTAAFPHLHEVRNSSHHHEDRVRNIKTGDRQIDLKPVENDFISAPGGGVMILDTLIGDRYGSTMADGHYGEVEVNEISLCNAADIHQRVLNAFKWHGSVQYQPGR